MFNAKFGNVYLFPASILTIVDIQVNVREPLSFSNKIRHFFGANKFQELSVLKLSDNVNSIWRWIINE